MYLSLWVCWSVPIYLPNLGRTGEGQSQTVTFKTFELERKAGTKQGVFCHCSPHLCPSFPVPRSFRPLPAPPISPLPSVEDRSVSLSCPLAGLIARAPLCTRRAPGYQRLCSSGPGGQLASSKGAAGKALLTGPRLHRMNSLPPISSDPKPRGCQELCRDWCLGGFVSAGSGSGVLVVPQGKHCRRCTYERLWRGKIYLWHHMRNQRSAPGFVKSHLLHPTVKKSTLAFIRPRHRPVSRDSVPH